MQIETTTAAAVTCHWDVRALIEPPSASQPPPPTLVIETEEHSHMGEPSESRHRRLRTKAPPEAQRQATAGELKANQPPIVQEAAAEISGAQLGMGAGKGQTSEEEH